MDEDMERGNTTWKHGREHGNMDKDMETWTRTWLPGKDHENRDNDMETWTRTGNEKQKTEGQAIFLNPFAICSLCKRKFVLCLFLDKETNGCYPFANRLNRLNGLGHLCRNLTS